MSSFVDDVKNLIDKQRSDVKKAFLCLHSPYKVRPQDMEHVKSLSNFFDANPGGRAFAEKVLVNPDQVQLRTSISSTMLPYDMQRWKNLGIWN